MSPKYPIDKHSLAYITGQAVFVTVGVCLAVLAVAGTVKLVMLVFGW